MCENLCCSALLHDSNSRKAADQVVLLAIGPNNGGMKKSECRSFCHQWFCNLNTLTPDKMSVWFVGDTVPSLFATLFFQLKL